MNAQCLQETEIPLNYPENILNHNDYLLELEQNDDKKRVGIYISKDIKFKRRADLEKKNCHIVIIDVLGIVNCRILNVYRSFRPPGLLSPNTFFDKQLEVISGALTSNSIVLGDFNLDAKM